MVSWNPEILNKHVATGISDFISANIADLRGDFDQAQYWLTNHFFK